MDGGSGWFLRRSRVEIRGELGVARSSESWVRVEVGGVSGWFLRRSRVESHSELAVTAVVVIKS